MSSAGSPGPGFTGSDLVVGKLDSLSRGSERESVSQLFQAVDKIQLFELQAEVPVSLLAVSQEPLSAL